MAKAKSTQRPSLRQQHEQAIAEAARWREFAQATQAVCLAQQREIVALTAELRWANAPRVGCDECEYTGFLPGIDQVDPNTGEVTRRLTLCPNCRPILDEFVDRYIGGVL
jgi:hypothetical protein